MAHSLEARCRSLDTTVMELAAQMPIKAEAARRQEESGNPAETFGELLPASDSRNGQKWGSACRSPMVPERVAVPAPPHHGHHCSISTCKVARLFETRTCSGLIEKHRIGEMGPKLSAMVLSVRSDGSERLWMEVSAHGAYDDEEHATFSDPTGIYTAAQRPGRIAFAPTCPFFNGSIVGLRSLMGAESFNRKKAIVFFPKDRRKNRRNQSMYLGRAA